MHKNWIAFLVIWAIVEFIQFLRKQPFPKRMLHGAVWAVFLVSIIELGQASRDVNTFGVLAAAIALNGLVAALICFVRVVLAKFLTRFALKKTDLQPSVVQQGVIASLGSVLGVWFKWLAVFFTLAFITGVIFTAAVWNK